MTTAKPILYVEDDENDAFLMRRAFGKLQLIYPLRILPDGKLAIAYLSGNAPYMSRDENPLPCLMFIDLSMPGKTGIEVLRWIKMQPTLASLPVIVLTSSNQKSDIQNAKLLGAKGYLVKPGDPNDLLRLVKITVEYWLAENRPSGNPPGAFTDAASVDSRFPRTLF